MNLSFPRASLSDYTQVIPAAEAFHEEDGHPLAKSGPAAIRALLEGSPLGEIFLILADGKFAGYFALTFTMSLEFGGLVVILDDFFVEENLRGQGIGQAVLEEVEKKARSKGAVQIFLEVEHANSRAFSFYERNGWKKRNRHMMEKHL